MDDKLRQIERRLYSLEADRDAQQRFNARVLTALEGLTKALGDLTQRLVGN